VARFVFFLGPAPSPWDPVSALDQGVGGSETAAIHLSRELALLGHEVMVYADVSRVEEVNAEDDSPLPLSVEWYPYRQMPARLPCDVFVSSRQPEARTLVLPHCRQAWLWMHDVHCGPDWDNRIGSQYDRVLCLSKWARGKFREYYPQVAEDRVFTTGNGLDASLFSPYADVPVVGGPVTVYAPGRQHDLLREGRVALRATYSSSPDRGLAKLLDLWPEVRELAGGGELHVYYGFDNWKKLSQLHESSLHVRLQIDRLEARVKSAPGVVYHGRAGQDEVARSFLRSQLWLYPTDFAETSCITAMEAQAAGCKVVATRTGALPETAPLGHYVEGPTRRPGFSADFLEQVSLALRADAPAHPAPRSWADVARQWEGWL